MELKQQCSNVFKNLNFHGWQVCDYSSNQVAIVAQTEISCGISSQPFFSKIFLKKIFNQTLPTYFINAFVTESGMLSVGKHFDWLPFIRVAQNCFEQNLTAQVVYNGEAVIVQTSRKISSGEELKVWPSTELLSYLNIPFLSPFNIISHQNYKCHRCETIFSQPNPLKIHLAFDCKSKDTFMIKKLEPISPVTSDLLNLKNNQNLTTNSNFQLVNKPITKEPKTHICIFCGKLYTRKYGLKIHLRTHTGHKPLKCKFCERPFSDPSNLNKHIRLHSQQNIGLISSPYKCNHCSKILVRRRDLERHLKLRHK